MDMSLLHFPNLVERSVDTWSLGCIYSVVATWVAHNWDMVTEYSTRRIEENFAVMGIEDGDCFHNGAEVLQAVKKHHNYIIGNLRPKDYVTKAVVRGLVKLMLQKRAGRPDIRNICTWSENIIQGAKTKLKPVNTSRIRQSQVYAAESSEADSTCSELPQTPTESRPVHDRRSPASKSPRQRSSPGTAFLPETSVTAASTSYRDSFGQHVGPSYGSSQNLQRLSKQSTPCASDRQAVSDPDEHLFSDTLPTQAFPDKPKSAVDLYPQLSTSEQSQAISHERWTLKESRERNSKDSRGAPPDEAQTFLHPPSHAHEPTSTTIGRTESKSSPRSGRRIAPDLRTPISPAAFHHRGQSTKEATPDITAAGSTKAVSVHHPSMTVAEGLDWKKDREQGTRRLEGLDTQSLQILDDRDHVSFCVGYMTTQADHRQAFLVDTAGSMSNHRRQVKVVIELLSYILKDSDPDGLDLYFTDSLQKLKPRTPATMLRELDRRPSGGSTDMRYYFSSVIDRYQRELGKTHYISHLVKKSQPKKGPRKLSLYVLTDGIWQPKCDLAGTVRTLVSHLEDHKLTHQQIGIQFIRFGDNAEAIDRLERLDAGLGLPLYVK